MITYTMTKNEVLSEVTKDVDWIADRKDGICVKFRKLLFPKKVKEGYRVLDVVQYVTPRHNKVYTIWIRVKRDKYLLVESIHYFEYMSQYGRVQYLCPFYNANGRAASLTIYTAHAIQRVFQRTGLSFMELMRYEANEGFSSRTGRYIYNNKETVVAHAGDKGFFILEDDRWGAAATTFISEDIMGKDQTDTMNECADESVAFQTARTFDFKEKLKDIPRSIVRNLPL